jgi:hypothetical protein
MPLSVALSFSLLGNVLLDECTMVCLSSQPLLGTWVDCSSARSLVKGTWKPRPHVNVSFPAHVSRVYAVTPEGVRGVGSGCLSLGIPACGGETPVLTISPALGSVCVSILAILTDVQSYVIVVSLCDLLMAHVQNSAHMIIFQAWVLLMKCLSLLTTSQSVYLFSKY